MRKRLTALLCAALLTAALLVLPSSAASGGLFFLSVNDTLPTLTAQTTPIQYNGWIYVPVNIFSSKVTGVNLGVYYGFLENDSALVLYNLSGKNMTFDLQKGTATAEGSSPPVPGKVVRQNGISYVPAYAVCQYFGLTYSYLSTDCGPLLRIRDGKSSLNDSAFVASAASMMRNRLSTYQREQAASAVPAPVTPTAPAAPSTPSKPAFSSKPAASKPAASKPAAAVPEIPAPVAAKPPVFSLTVGLRASSEGNLSGLLNVLSGSGVRAVVFFPANRVEEFSDSLRQTAGQGHRIGLIPVGDTPGDRLKSVREGEAAVARLLRQEVWFTLNADEALTEAGYLSWSPGLTLSSSDGADALYGEIVAAGADRSSALRLLLDDTMPSKVLSAVLLQLSGDGDTFLIPKETSY